MQIATYCKSKTDKIKGFVFDTEECSYKMFDINSDDWKEYLNKFGCHIKKENFKMAGDIVYRMDTIVDVSLQLSKIEALGYSADDTMVLDFGIFKR